MKRAERALQRERIFEARKWTSWALEMKPNDLATQRLMAQVLDREIARAKSHSRLPSTEELPAEQKTLQIKTWLERSQGFLEIHQFDEALRAAEEVFRIDPKNLEASRRIDQIKEKARSEGQEETLFIQELAEEEIQARIPRYLQQAKAWLEADRRGPARLAIEKVLFLDPQNAEGRRLQALLEQKEKTAGPSEIRDRPGGE